MKFPLSILKSVWSRQDGGRWAITDLKGIDLTSDEGADKRRFILRGEIQQLTHSPGRSILDAVSLFGSAEFLMQQSIVPVVAWLEGEQAVRCIGTASIISCSGYVLTAAHVLIDPLESGYGAVRSGSKIKYHDHLHFGVLIPHWLPLGGVNLQRDYLLFPFQKLWFWGEWRESPLIHVKDTFEYLTDIAICKIPEFPDGRVHQPLQISLNPFVPHEDAYALGYAEAPDMPLNPADGSIADRSFRFNLHVSVGNVISTFPQNHTAKQVSAPGPCFDFSARISGKMSGAPIFGARGAVIRGVVSRSFSCEEHAYGSMLSPAMDLPLNEEDLTGRTLRTLLDSDSEGMAKITGAGL